MGMSAVDQLSEALVGDADTSVAKQLTLQQTVKFATPTAQLAQRIAASDLLSAEAFSARWAVTITAARNDSSRSDEGQASP